MSLDVASSTVAATVAWQWKCRIDEVCERFEDAWRQGGVPPAIEQYLDDPAVNPARRAALLAELLKVERELRQDRGEKPIAAEYLAKFPAHGLVVRSVFGEDRVGDYDLIAPIGEGGMGVVYHARHRRIGREVALKMIRAHALDDPSAVERFRLEARLAARLDHENIVTVYEAGFADGQHYYAMRYIVGRSLAEEIGKKPMSEARATRYLEQVARAVDFAHTQDVLHRDIKPRNILIDSHDRAVVTDFGLAKLLSMGTGATRTDDRLGTPPYMSPEQVRDPSRAGMSSDVYSLGATLYEALTGRPPFQAENPLEVYRQILDDEPTPPRTLNRRCSRDLETICMKCLEKEPGRRYASALQLAEDLRRVRSGTPILARRVGPIERMRKLAARYPTAALLLAVSAILLVTIGAVIQSRRVNATLERGDERNRAFITELTQFGESRLNEYPELQRELLNKALTYYHQFLKDRGADPDLVEDVASAYSQVARLSTLLGEPAGALNAHNTALKFRRGLVARSPSDRRFRSDLAETLHNIGILRLAAGDRPGSISAYREALALREALIASDPGCAAFVTRSISILLPEERALVGDLARSHGYIGDWEREGGLREDARNSYRKSRELRARLLETDPNDLLAKFQLARSESNAGTLEREAGRLREALQAHESAMKLQTELFAIGPEGVRKRLDEAFRASGRVPDVEFDNFLTDLAASKNALGVIYAEMGFREQAIDLHSDAFEKYDRLALEHPKFPNWDADRGWTSTYLGILREDATDLELGRTIFQALLDTNPHVLRNRAGMARNRSAEGERLLKEGLVADARPLLEFARKEQEQLVRYRPNNGDYRIDLDRTVEALRRARGR